ncbi:MAG: host-nuclease inhibitor Gam family protein [Syntrophobacter sp.]
MARTAAAKETAYPTPHHEHIDEMLSRAGDLTSRVRAVETQCKAELDALTAKHKKAVTPIKQELETLDDSIRDYTRKHQVDLFEGRDRIDLANGALLHQVERRVKRIRKMPERLEAIKADDAIKTVKSVDWDVIEKWTDERLIEVGTERVKKETFAYELAGVKEARKSAQGAV